MYSGLCSIPKALSTSINLNGSQHVRLEFNHIHCDFDCNCIWLYWVPQETCHFWKVKSTQQGYLQLGYEKPWHEAAALTMGVAFASLKGQQLRWIIHIESWNHCNGWCLECQGSWLHAEPRKYRWQLLDREWCIFGKDAYDARWWEYRWWLLRPAASAGSHLG